MDRKLIDNVNKNVKMFMEAGGKGLKDVQDAPPGKEKVSQRSLGIMIKKLQDLPVHERQSRLTEIANLMGHKGDKLDDCELCKFIVSGMMQK